jgi:hypothetical protein
MAPASGRPFDSDPARALAEAHFSHLHAFNMVAAYESRSQGETVTFVVARRVTGGRSELLMKLRDASKLRRERAPLNKTLMWLMIHNRGRSDDLMVYVPFMRRVRRLSAPELQRQPAFGILPLGDLRPIVPGELRYRFLSREPEAWVIEGRPVDKSPGFDRLELSFEPDAPIAVRTVFFRQGEELRRVEIDPDDVTPYQGRLLPRLMRIVTPNGGTTEVRMRNVLVDLLLPEEIFTEHNLWVQRFPNF